MMTEWPQRLATWPQRLATRTFTLLGLRPQLFPLRCAEGVEGPALRSRERFHHAETPLELRVRSPQCFLRIDPQMAAPVGQGEQQIPQLLSHLRRVGRIGAAQCLLDLAQLFCDLQAHLRCIRPVEANTRGAPAYLLRALQCRKRPGNIREDSRLSTLSALRRLCPLERLQLFPA